MRYLDEIVGIESPVDGDALEGLLLFVVDHFHQI